MKNAILILILSLSFASCKKDLVDTTDNSITDITTLDGFNQSIANGTSMVFFHAVWCHNCEELRPTIEKVSENESQSSVNFIEVDYDETRDIFKEYEVDGFPQVLFFVDGVEQERLVGKNQSEQQILDILNKYK